MKIIIPSNSFKKKLKKIDRKIIYFLKQKVLIFEEDEFSPTLNNHKIQGKYEGCRSINITGDWRLIYKKNKDSSYLLIDIGTHSELYD